MNNRQFHTAEEPRRDRQRVEIMTREQAVEKFRDERRGRILAQAAPVNVKEVS